MVARPRGDLGALVVPKVAAAQVVPHAGPPLQTPAVQVPATPSAPADAPAAPPAALPAPTGAPTALTVKLPPELYRRLRRYCLDREEATGRRVTHQDVMVAALVALLPADGRRP
jgi:hypothetical protein